MRKLCPVVAEELLNLLARVDGLKVASRTSSFAYKGEHLNVPEIAAQLKVANILEGSVRKAGNRVRITVQLIDTRDDRHLWSETYDRELVDIFANQDEIASAIVDALQTKLGVRASAENIVVKAATDNLDAYELYLKGRTLFTARQRIDEGIALFQRAIELNPELSMPYAVLGMVGEKPRRELEGPQQKGSRFIKCIRPRFPVRTFGSAGPNSLA